ncbi:hypothetical protein PJ985_10355 [Streptomyces sp. ACA25]|uniref:hypothetical protein n=1 Tax=Streptomyces sp. ACA25 TaxID=3022596 RepID=UPI00230736CA|nr:hypothetical protein [Streptomyces sp. ACA25]MDB1087967.1 hypothetical protein [Streptomyces sp. ACA25]
MSDPTTPQHAGASPAPPAASGVPRHRAASPVVPPGMQPGALTAALAVLIAGAAVLGQWALLPAVIVLQAVTAAGWFRLNGMWPARQGIAAAFAAGLTADIALLAAPADRAMSALIGTLAVWFLVIVLLQLRHHGSADERLDSLTATAAATVLTVLAAGFLAAGAQSVAAVVVTAAAVAAATLVRAVLRQPYLSPVVAWAVAAAVGAAAGVLREELSLPAGVLLGLAGGVCALIGLRVASYDFPSRFVHFTAGVALPLTAAAPAAHLLAWLL